MGGKKREQVERGDEDRERVDLSNGPSELGEGQDWMMIGKDEGEDGRMRSLEGSKLGRMRITSRGDSGSDSMRMRGE